MTLLERGKAFKKLMDTLWGFQFMKQDLHEKTADTLKEVYTLTMKYSQGSEDSDPLILMPVMPFNAAMIKFNTGLEMGQIPMRILHDDYHDDYGVLEKHWFMSIPSPANLSPDVAKAHLIHYLQGWNASEREKGLGGVRTEKEIFTYLYNIAYSPFYPDDPKAEYDITDINLLCHHRNIPFQLRVIKRLVNPNQDMYHYTPYTETVVRIERCNW